MRLAMSWRVQHVPPQLFSSEFPFEEICGNVIWSFVEHNPLLVASQSIDTLGRERRQATFDCCIDAARAPPFKNRRHAQAACSVLVILFFVLLHVGRFGVTNLTRLTKQLDSAKSGWPFLPALHLFKLFAFPDAVLQN